MSARHFRHAAIVEMLIVGLVLSIAVIVIASRDGHNAPLSSIGHAAEQASVVADATPSPHEIALPVGLDERLRLSTSPSLPAMTQEEAMQIVASQLGISFALGGDWEGEPVTLTGYVGNATFGETNPASGVWLGPQGFTLPSGATLDRIENRPLWILDYRHAGLSNPAVEDAGVFNHTVYLVDVETRTVLLVISYEGS